MHYYKFNIADYRKDTAHLSPIEHYIYRSLMDWYYLDEKPIPKKTQVVMRRLGFGSIGLLENTEMLENVLNDFFIETDNGFEHKRIAQEILEYEEKGAKNRQNGKLGGRPKGSKQKLVKPKITQVVNSDNPSESEHNPNHKPLTTNHKPLEDIEEQDKPKKKRFVPPTIEECIEHSNNQEESEKFVLYYESNGWKVNRNKMVNWKSALTGWIKRSDGFKVNRPQQTTINTRGRI